MNLACGDTTLLTVAEWLELAPRLEDDAATGDLPALMLASASPAEARACLNVTLRLAVDPDDARAHQLLDLAFARLCADNPQLQGAPA